MPEPAICCKGHVLASWRLAEIGTLLQVANLGRAFSCRKRSFAAGGMFWRRGALQKSAHCCRRPIWAGLFLAEIGRLLQRACLGGEGPLHLSVLCCKRHPCIRGWRFCFCHPYMSGHHRSHGHAGRSAARPASALVPPNRSHSPASRPPRAFAAAPVPRDRPHAPLPRWPPTPIRLPPLTPALHTFAKSLRAAQPGAPIPPWAPLRRQPQPLVHKRAFATSSGESLSRISVPGVASRNQ